MIVTMYRVLICTLLFAQTLCLGQSNLSVKKEAQILAFLDRYAGRWVGKYELRDMNGAVLKELEADLVYHWESDENGRVLKGRAVYGSNDGMIITESETFITNRQIFSIVKDSGKQRTYRGVIDESGKEISWSPIDVDNPLDESIRETFGRDSSGRDTLVSQSYQDLERNGISMLLTMNGVLFREAMDTSSDTPPQQ